MLIEAGLLIALDTVPLARVSRYASSTSYFMVLTAISDCLPLGLPNPLIDRSCACVDGNILLTIISMLHFHWTWILEYWQRRTQTKSSENESRTRRTFLQWTTDNRVNMFGSTSYNNRPSWVVILSARALLLISEMVCEAHKDMKNW